MVPKLRQEQASYIEPGTQKYQFLRITTVGVAVEEALADIGIKARNVVIHMECDGKAYWVRSLG